MLNFLYSVNSNQGTNALPDFEILNLESEISIKRYPSRASSGQSLLKIGILSDYICDPIAKALQIAAGVLGIGIEIVDFQIEQIENLILNSKSEIYTSNIDILLIYPDYDKQLNLPNTQSLEEISLAILERWHQLWKQISEYSDLVIFQHNFPQSLKINGVGTEQDSVKILAEINQKIMHFRAPNIFWIDIHKESIGISEGEWLDPRLLELVRLPFHIKMMPKYVFTLLRSFHNYLKNPLKLIIVDLDGTLWPSNLAEDGPRSVISKINRSKNELFGVAKFLESSKKSGILLAICSKNFESEVSFVFQNIENFPLKLDDFVKVRANWINKSQNIKEILQEMRFAQENVCFIDNSIEQCIEVKSAFPKMLVLHSDNFKTMDKNDFIESGLFDSKSSTKEDAIRNASYEVNRRMSEATLQNLNMQDFLSNLGMECNYSRFNSEDQARVEQMLERTNQFRANTEFNFQFKTPDIEFIKFGLLDKYTDYGTISIIAVNFKNDSILIPQWLMSCRVFGRGIELEILRVLLNHPASKLSSKIKIDFRPNSKNNYLADLLGEIGFKFSKTEELYVCESGNINFMDNHVKLNGNL